MAGLVDSPDTKILEEQPSSMQHPLRILIVGAGIGGLSAAVALRQQGHHVELFERSRLAQETGAAIHVGPNCNGLLRRLGLFVENIGAVECEMVNEYNPQNGSLAHSAEVGPFEKTTWAHPWHLVHRAHLHTALKHMALEADASGGSCVLNTSSCVKEIDAANGVIILEDSSERHGDVIIGADGVHSVTRRAIPGGDLKPFGSGKSAFRFLLSTEMLRSDPRTATFVEKPGCLNMWTADDRRLIMYPCANNTVVNFVAIHPSHESSEEVTERGWNQGGSKSRMLQIFSGFHSSVSAILEKVDGNKLSVWELLDMPKMPKFATGRLALLGDAAHPFLPYQGQGGAQAIEDAVSLSALLPQGTSPSEVPERLQLYEICRYERAHRIQEFTRRTGKDAAEAATQEDKIDAMACANYNFNWDEWDHSVQALARHLAAQHTSAGFPASAEFDVLSGPDLRLGNDMPSSGGLNLCSAMPQSSIT